MATPDCLVADFSDGHPLPADLRRALEARLGADLGRVRLHVRAGRTAHRTAAPAFTVGRHIFLDQNDFRLREPDSFRLLAHESAHAIQQGFCDPGAGPLESDPDPACEAEAAAAEWGSVTPLRRVGPAVQRHRGSCPNCPPPQWIEIGAGDRAVWMPANQAIEIAYALSHPRNVFLFGSQFEGWRDIRLPSGVPNRAACDAVLDQLRGRSQQLAPDIIDFTDRVVYEIKTARTAADGRRYLDGIYPLLDSITGPMGGPHFNRAFAGWLPPEVLPLPGSLVMRACTAASRQPTRTDGLILYQVYRRASPEEEQEAARQLVAVQALHPELREMRERVVAELARVARGVRESSEWWIVCTEDFYRKFVEEPAMDRVIDRMRVHGMDARRNPVIGFRNLGWTLLAIAAVTEVVVCTVVLSAGLAAEVAAAGAVAATATAAAGTTTAPAVAGGVSVAEATVISLNAIRAARAAEATRRMAAAAGVLFTVSTVTVARAEGRRATVTRTGSVSVVPAAEVGRLFGPEADYQMGRRLTHNGQNQYIIGRATIG